MIAKMIYSVGNSVKQKQSKRSVIFGENTTKVIPDAIIDFVVTIEDNVQINVKTTSGYRGSERNPAIRNIGRTERYRSKY